MSSLKRSFPGFAPAGGRPRANAFCGIAILALRSLIVALMMAVAGCATPDRPPDLPQPVEIPDSTWWRVDSEIGAAALAATGPARKYARGQMESWRSLVQARAEADFIPWFTGYWTQQWLAVKVAWYKLGAEEGTDPAVDRLAVYLQEQYNERVLEPVAREIDPDAVRGEATMLYVQILGEHLQGIRRRYGVPQAQFDRHLQDIPAIALAPPHSASLYLIVHADPLARLPAFVALTARFGKATGGAGGTPPLAGISPVAKRASENIVARLGPAVGASAAAAAVGGVAGIAISLGAAGFGAIAYEKERPEIEAQLRESLDAALVDMWQSLMDDPARGVMAGVHHISGEIDRGLTKTFAQPVELKPLPREIPLPGEQAPADEEDRDHGVADNR
ncbi:MAG: hypothetical protein JNK92_07335 [Dechloromonas sp.]|nr:hypothetical protein [Dechloromonas sp.]